MNPLPMIITRLASGRIIYANQRAAELLRTPLDVLVGSLTADFYQDPEARARFVAQLRETGEVDLLETPLRLPDGEVRPLAINAKLMPFQGETAIVAGLQDLSPWRRMEQALHQSEKLAALGSLLAGVAHELNNPLSIALAHATLLEEGMNEPQTKARAKKIRLAAERCGRTVKSFLAIARQRTPDHSHVVLGEVVAAAIDLTAYGLRTSGSAQIARSTRVWAAPRSQDGAAGCAFAGQSAAKAMRTTIERRKVMGVSRDGSREDDGPRTPA